jgi:hypothetical protein
VLEDTLNGALTLVRKFYEKCSHFGRTAHGSQSERLTAIGVMWRGPGIARRPAAV